MKILFTGGTGLIGRQLIRQLKPNHKISVLTRAPTKAFEILGHDIDAYLSLEHITNFNFDAVINLAGEPIADKRWTQKQKNKICQSRWQITEQLTSMIQKTDTKPKVFISGSAVGYYGRQPNHVVVDELHNEIHTEFTHQLCSQWENLAREAENETRLCIIRTGLVLAKHGGILAKMKPAFICGLGGPIGDGQQMMSWIHIDDAISAIEYLLYNDQCQGVYNLTAPAPVSNQTFSQTLADQLKRPNACRMPSFAAKLLFGEMADLLLTGQAVMPTRLAQAGFIHRYPELTNAITQCVHKKPIR